MWCFEFTTTHTNHSPGEKWWSYGGGGGWLKYVPICGHVSFSSYYTNWFIVFVLQTHNTGGNSRHLFFRLLLSSSSRCAMKWIKTACQFWSEKIAVFLPNEWDKWACSRLQAILFANMKFIRWNMMVKKRNCKESTKNGSNISKVIEELQRILS